MGSGLFKSKAVDHDEESIEDLNETPIIPTIIHKQHQKVKIPNGSKIINGYQIVRKNIGNHSNPIIYLTNLIIILSSLYIDIYLYLGKGAFAKVHKAQDVKTKEFYAIKKMSRFALKKKKDYFRDDEGNMACTTALDKVELFITSIFLSFFLALL